MALTGWFVPSKERLTKRPTFWMPLWAPANRHTCSEEGMGGRSSVGFMQWVHPKLLLTLKAK